MSPKWIRDGIWKTTIRILGIHEGMLMRNQKLSITMMKMKTMIIMVLSRVSMIPGKNLVKIIMVVVTTVKVDIMRKEVRAVKVVVKVERVVKRKMLKKVKDEKELKILRETTKVMITLNTTNKNQFHRFYKTKTKT